MSNENPQLQTFSSIANILLIFTGIVGTSLMLAGFSYRLGYFGSFGLNIGAVPLEFGESIGEAFYMALLLIVEIFTQIWWPFILILSFIVLLFVIAAFFLLGKKIGLNHKINKWLATFDKPAQEKSLFIRIAVALFDDFSQHAFKAILVLAAITFYPYYVIIKPYELGTSEAKDQIQKISELDYDCFRLPEIGLNCASIIKVSSGDVIAQGAIIAGNSANHLVIYDGQNIQMFYKSSDYSISIRTTLTEELEKP